MNFPIITNSVVDVDTTLSEAFIKRYTDMGGVFRCGSPTQYLSSNGSATE